MRALFLFIIIGYAFGQKGDDLDSIIGKIFPKPATDSSTAATTTTTFSLQPVAGGGGGKEEEDCECVPTYLCNNGTINTDGRDIIDIRVDKSKPQSKCHYLTPCCKPENKLKERKPVLVEENKPKGCGVRNPFGVGYRLKGNENSEAQFGEFPWMVAVLREESVEGNTKTLSIYQCGGSLIHPQVVLTSAHCIQDKTQKYKIRAGEWDTQTTYEMLPHQDRDVKTVISHPDYYGGALFNDIALLILASPVEIDENVDTVCLPTQGQVVENSKCFATGWGKDVFGQKGQYQVILKRIELPIVRRDVCQDQLRTTRLGSRFKLHESFICAGGEPGKDVCKGDGGGPLVCPVPGDSRRYFQAGIVAWGIGCGEDGIPGVYANVAGFIDWIHENLAPYNIDKASYTY